LPDGLGWRENVAAAGRMLLVRRAGEHGLDRAPRAPAPA
jgi:hypothetical protein